ncbi:MAG TPA: hypothetical protein VKS60_05185, partial [Stellaceae bacterium]|nr:hypothetical protein [Stellaceae bacterium]
MILDQQSRAEAWCRLKQRRAVHPRWMLWIASFAMLFSSTGFAADRVYREAKRIDLTHEFATQSKWEAVFYTLEPEGGGDIGDIPVAMKFCLVGGTRQQIASKQADCDKQNDGSPFKLYATSVSARVVNFSKQHVDWKGFVVDTDTSFGGSGSRIGTTVWSYNSKFDTFEDRFHEDHNNIGDSMFVEDGPLDGYYITTEFVWMDGNTHYAKHRHRVHVYKYIPNYNFTEVLSYITEKMYPSTTDVPQHQIPVSEADRARGVIGYDEVG